LKKTLFKSGFGSVRQELRRLKRPAVSSSFRVNCLVL